MAAMTAMMAMPNLRAFKSIGVGYSVELQQCYEDDDLLVIDAFVQGRLVVQFYFRSLLASYELSGFEGLREIHRNLLCDCQQTFIIHLHLVGDLVTMFDALTQTLDNLRAYLPPPYSM